MGGVIKNESIDENGTTTISYSSGFYGSTVFSQTIGTNGTVRTTKNEYDDSGNLLKTVTRYTASIPANTWDMVYEYDLYNRVVKTTDGNGVETHTEYRTITGAGMIDQVVATWTQKTNSIINKTTYEYYAETAPVHQRYRLWKEIKHLDQNTTYTTTFDYIAADNDNPQNIGKLWKKTYADNSFEEFSYGCCDAATARNRNGGVTTYVRDAAGKVTSQTEPSGAVTTYTYDAAGRVLTTVIPAGGTITNAYDAQGRLIRTDYPDSSFTATTFRVDGQTATETSRTGLVTTYTYRDSDGLLVETSTTGGTLQEITYDDISRVSTSTDARGLTLSTLYDDYGNAYKTVWPDSTYTELTFNAASQLTTSRDRLGNTTDFEYDDFGRQTTVESPSGLRKETVYDALSRVTSATIDDGTTELTTSYTLNADSKPTTIAYPDSTTEVFTYTDTLLTAYQDRAGKSWTYTFTAAKLPDQVSAPDSLGTVSDTNYIASGANAGSVSSYTGSDGITVTFTYDNMGRITRKTMPDSTYSATTYGVSGPLTEADRSGRTTTYTYDNYGRRISVEDPEGRTTVFEYNLAGDMVSMTDANENETTWTYNTQGRMTVKTFADTSTYEYEYNANGLVTSRTDANNQTTAYAYNNLGQLTGVDYPNDTDISFSYDSFGRRTSMTDSSGTTGWTYSNASDILTENGPFVNDTVAYTYSSGRRATMTFNSANQIQYGYDSAGRISSVGIPARIFSYSYLNVSNKVATLSLNSTQIVANTYDTLGRLTQKNNSRNAGIPAGISSFSYTYNNSDERTKVTLADNRYINYTYDDAGQVESAKRYHPSETQDYGYNYGYTYDPMGNPATKSTQGQSRTYTANDLNQIATATAPTATDLVGKVAPELTAPYTVTVNGQSATVDSEGNFVKQGVALSSGQNQITVNATDKFGRTDQKIVNVSLASAPVFSYDYNGNMTSDGIWNFTWNDENHLVSAELTSSVVGSKKVENIYDGMGRRRVKTVSTWGGSQYNVSSVERFVYDGWNLVAVLDSSNNPVKTFVWGTDISGSLQGAGGVGGLLSVSVPSTSSTYFPSYDGNGNITAYVDSSGMVEYSCFYGPFGLVVEGSGTSPCEFGFSTKYTDAETDLVYYGLRFYSPILCRWINRDPIEEKGGWNLYEMCSNNAINAIDLFGAKRLTLTYDFAFPNWFERNLHEPSNTEWVKKMKDVTDSIIKQIKKYSSDGTDPCNCIEKITIAGHSGSPGKIEFGDGFLSDDTIVKMNDKLNEKRKKAAEFTMKREVEFLNTIKSYLCDKSTIDLVYCESGKGDEGKILRDFLEDFFGGDKTSIILYEKKVKFVWGSPKCIDCYEPPQVGPPFTGAP